MGFRTKLDFSDNRQVKQRIETTTVLSGATSFGVPYNQLPTGPNYALSAITLTIPPSSATTGTFSGNNTTTVFTWPINDLYLADSTFSAITPSNSAFSQTSSFVFTADTNTMFTVDGNVGYGSYTGVGFTMFATSMVDLGGGSYSGTVNFTNVNYVEAPGLDFSGRTIWNDVSGITRTERLIITDNPQVGYVWTCIDSEGMGEWQYNGSSSGSTIWTAGTGVSSAVLGGSGGNASGAYSVAAGLGVSATTTYSFAEGFYTLADGSRSHAEGSMTQALGGSSHAEGVSTVASGSSAHAENRNTIAGGDNSHAGGLNSYAYNTNGFIHSNLSTIDVNSDDSAILGGSGNTINNAKRVVILGGANITATTSDTVYMNNLYATNANSNFYTNFNTSNENGVIMNGGNNTLTYIESNINSSNSIRVGVRGSSVALWDEYGKNNDSFLYSSIDNNGLNIISAPGTGTEDYIRFYAGQNAESIYTPDLHIQGTGSTRGYVGINNDNPLQLLHLKSSNEAKILIQADTDNINENDNAELLLTQDGGGSTANFSITPDTSNNLLIGVNSATVPDILFATRSDSTVFTTSADTKMILKNYGDLILKNTTSDSKFGINTIVPQYTIDAYGDTDSRLFYNGTAANGGAFNLSATTGLPLFGVIAGTANTANQTASISLGVRAWDDPTYTVYGYQGDAFIYAGIYTNGLNIISNDGSTLGTGADYIRFYAGQSTGAGATNNPDLHIQGSGSSRGFVAINIPYNQDPTQRLDVNGNARFRSIGSSASAGALHYTSDGTLTTNTSDERLKTNINTLTNALEKVKQLRGVNYNWKEEENGDVRIGFIAQEVNKIVPELTFINKNSDEQYMGVHYDNVTALLVEAIKELSTGSSIVNNTYLETQTVLAEDNNIELNFNGNHITAVGGGLRVLHAKGQDNASELVTDNEGNFVTNNDFKPNALTIPFYTPSSTNDVNGNEGNITRDDNFLYVKTSTGWKRTNLENF